MDNIVYQDYFQFILNQFLVFDKDLIPWKLSCTSCYYYPHKVYISNANVSNSNIAKFLCPTRIDTRKCTQPIPTLGRTLCKCGLNMKLTNTFNFDNFHSLKYVEELTLDYSPITDSQLSKMTSLRCLDLGTYNNITDEGLKKLTNLEMLFLGNNWYITKDIFNYLSKLRMIQIGYEVPSQLYCSIHLNEIPDHVQEVICDYFDELMCIYEDDCDPLYLVNKSSEQIRG